MDKKLYKFGMDWLNGVLPVEDVADVFKLLGQFSSKLRFERWQLTNSGKYNYKRRYMLDGNASIQLMYNPVSEEELYTACKPVEYVSLTSYIEAKGTSNNPYIFFSISGDGIRYLHTLGGDVSALNKLLFYFYRNGFRASRFDTYCDILDSNNEIVPLITEAFSFFGREQVGKPFIRTKIRRSNNNFKRFPLVDDNGIEWWNSQLGHHGSTVGMFRCYNKYIEMLEGRLENVASNVFKEYDIKDYWYRLEYEMHKDNADKCFKTLMERAENCNSPLCFEDIFYSVFERLFSIGVANSKWQLVDGSHSVPAAWSTFASELSSSAECFVQFGAVPYVKCTLSRLDRNMDRISSYVYITMLRLFSLSKDDRLRYMLNASDKFHKNKKYNLLRDEFDELPVDNLASRIFDAIA